jgi:ribose transport system substrate-binding protein
MPCNFTIYMSRIFIISIALILGFTACRNEVSIRKPGTKEDVTDSLKSRIDLSGIKVGYCSPSLNAPFYVVLSQYVKKYAEGYGMQFVMADGQDDILKQITSTEDMVATGINILILNPLDHKALVPAVNAAARNGVTVFIVDSQIDPAADFITSIQASNEGNGELLGEWVVKQMQGSDIKIALISGSQGNPVGQAKRLGFIEGFAETQLITFGHSDMKIVSQGWGNWTLLGGLEAMEDILTAHPDVNVLVAENDAMGMGAIKAINEAGKSGQILVVGYDGQKEAYELIKEGKFGATALNSPKELARLAVESVVKYLNGERLDKIIHTPAVLITKDDVEQYYDHDALF